MLTVGCNQYAGPETTSWVHKPQRVSRSDTKQTLWVDTNMLHATGALRAFNCTTTQCDDDHNHTVRVTSHIRGNGKLLFLSGERESNEFVIHTERS